MDLKYLRVPVITLATVIGSLLVIAMLFTAGWSRPSVDAEQTGFRGVAMEKITNPRDYAKLVAANKAPEPPYAIEMGGTPASQIYKNVKVLGDLNEEQFLRLMGSITEWVAPQQGCAYCHNEENLASDEKYTKTVSLKMLEMTRALNSNWDGHVKTTGVTCYTCHRGKNIPEQVWFKNDGPPMPGGFTASRNGQNLASKSVGVTSLPFDPFSLFLAGGENGTRQIAVNTHEAFPSGNEQHIQDAEKTYGLMMHFSGALGVNCTHCHNSRAFYDWEQSPPTRLQAQLGIGMVQEINSEFLKPLTDVFPKERKGPSGDVAKVNCATCHQGVNKPLFGAAMAKDHPSLMGK